MKNLKEKAQKLEQKMDDLILVESYKSEYEEDDDPELVELLEDYQHVNYDYAQCFFEFCQLMEETLKISDFDETNFHNANSASGYWTFNSLFDSDEYNTKGLFESLNSSYNMDFTDYDYDDDPDLSVELVVRKSDHNHAHGGFTFSVDPDGLTVTNFFAELNKLNKLIESYKS